MDFNSLLKLMVSKSGSDLFITAGTAPTMKVHGRMVPVSKNPLSMAQSHELVTGLMTSQQKEEFERTSECNFAISAAGLSRFRVSAFIQRNSAGMVLRRIESRIPTPEELKLPKILGELAMTKRGLIVFVGATGSGKSTSLASMVGHRNKHSGGHILTIEDPVEFIHPHQGCIVTQREVGIDTESYDVALKNALRQAPDVILVGEVRARETLEAALSFADTGHLCLTTLHANNADQALDRIINFFPEERRHQVYMELSLNLRAIIAQQLVPHVDGKSRRVGVEVLINTPLASDIIRKGEIHELKELMKRSREQGMRTFDQALIDLYEEGEISYDNALLHADSANEVRLAIKLSKKSRDVPKSAMDKISLVGDDDLEGF